MKKKVFQFLASIRDVDFEQLSLEELEAHEVQINSHLDQRAKSQFLSGSDEESLYQYLETIGEYKSIAPMSDGRKLQMFAEMSSY